MESLNFFSQCAFASDQDGFYRIFPIYKFDSLVTLIQSEKDNPEKDGEKQRVFISDLLDYYTLFDKDMKVIKQPSDSEEE